MKKLDTHFKEILSKGSVSLLAKVLGVGANFALQVILGRVLGADGVGLYYLSLTVVTFAALLARMGLDYNLTRVVASGVVSTSESGVREYFNYAFKIGVISSVLMSILLWLSAPFLTNVVFGKQELLAPLRVMTLGLPPLALSILLARALQGLRKTGAAIMIEFTVTPLIACVFVFALISTYEVTGAAIAYCIGASACLLFAAWAWIRGAGDQLSVKENIGSGPINKVIGESLPYLGVLVLQQIAQVLPLLALGVLATSAEVGVYYAAMRTAALTGLVLIAVNSILAPKLAALYQLNDMKSLDQIVRSSGLLILSVAAPVLILFIALPEFVMQIFGADFTGHGNLLRIMAVGQLINVATGTLGYVLMMTNRGKAMFVTTLWMAVANAVLCLAFIPAFGAYGAAVALAGSLLVAGIARVVLIWRELGILALPIPIGFMSRSRH